MSAMIRIWLLVMLLSGCSTIPEQVVHTSNTFKVVPDAWQAQGRVGVVFNGRTENVGFKLDFKKQAYQLTLTATLGVGQIMIESNNLGLLVDGKLVESNFEHWMTRELGWYFPIQKLAPILFQHEQQVDDKWAISISNYQQINKVNYPKIVRLNHLTKPIKIKLLISEVNQLK
ncbi:hypothetical protein MNB_SUP05-10-843 [hydrothermal vent metagenome]|uniref:Outer-membrane lipoprotein LolB n=2 Tax=hydrothermal vent metagenome TaxID=652676 RepID=A0A1W1DC54_9ZZZZ